VGRFAGLVAAGTVAAMTLAGCSSGSDAEPSSETLPTATVTETVTVEASPTASVTTTPTPVSTPVAPPPPATSEQGRRDPLLDLPLIDASASGDVDQVRTLLRRGASVRATDVRGRTPLVAAAYGNHVAVAQVLVSAGADPNEKDGTVQSAYLISTSEVGDAPALLDLLLDAGADVTSRDSFNGTGLIRAAERGYPRIVRRLLATDIEVDHVNRLGWTALHEAIVLGDGGPSHVRVVELLVDAGADVNLPGDGQSPLAQATSRGYTQIADVLREAGAQP
jgi:uncharacterized protein